MATVSLFFIEGMIDPSQNVPCGREVFSRPLEGPMMRTSQRERTVDALKRVFGDFENPPLEIWKIRTFAYVALSSAFCSVTFIPYNLHSTSLLFVQKNIESLPVQGFLAPYLPEEVQKKWGCLERAEVSSEINTEEEMIDSIQNVDCNIYLDVKIVLSYFLRDSWSAAIGLTYSDGISRFWYKKV